MFRNVATLQCTAFQHQGDNIRWHQPDTQIWKSTTIQWIHDATQNELKTNLMVLKNVTMYSHHMRWRHPELMNPKWGLENTNFGKKAHVFRWRLAMAVIHNLSSIIPRVLKYIWESWKYRGERAMGPKSHCGRSVRLLHQSKIVSVPEITKNSDEMGR